MELESRVWSAEQGWSAPLPADLDGSGTLVLVFGDQAIGAEEGAASLTDVRTAFPRSHVVGCSTAGQILGGTLTDSTVVVGIARFDTTRCRAPRDGGHPDESFAAGQAVARTLAAPGLKAVFVFSDGLLVNGSELVRGLSSALAGRRRHHGRARR